MFLTCLYHYTQNCSLILYQMPSQEITLALWQRSVFLSSPYSTSSQLKQKSSKQKSLPPLVIQEYNTQQFSFLSLFPECCSSGNHAGKNRSNYFLGFRVFPSDDQAINAQCYGKNMYRDSDLQDRSGTNPFSQPSMGSVTCVTSFKLQLLIPLHDF